MTDHASLEPDDLTALPDSARRVAQLLRERGHAGRIVMLPETGKTSAEAAAGLGCSVAQIAKSILFRRREDDAPVLVVASGANRVDEKKVAAQVGEIGRAAESEMRSRDVPTGTVGGRIAGTQRPARSSVAAISSVASFAPMISGCTAVCESTGSHGVAFSIARVRSISCWRWARRVSPSSPPMIRRLADTACAAAGTDAVVKIYGRARCTSHSITVSCATTNAPDTPAALPSVPIEIRFGERNAAWAMAPRPCGPSTPKPCASSTISHAPCCSASSSKRASGAISPSMLNTVSETMTLTSASDASSIALRASVSQCG